MVIKRTSHAVYDTRYHKRYSISDVVQRLKRISAREIFRSYPEVKIELCRGEFGEEVRTYVKHHKDHEKSQRQLNLF